MTLRERIREWLGITDLRAEVSMLDNSLMSLHSKTDRNTRTLGTITPGLGRIIAKLDPQVARDELSPAMRAESDRLADETIRRLQGEQAVRDHYGYTPKDTDQ